MTGTGYTAAGGQDPRGRDPRVLFVALDHTGDGYTVGPESLLAVEVRALDSLHLRVERREARTVNRFEPADGTIAFTGYAMAEEP